MCSRRQACWALAMLLLAAFCDAQRPERPGGRDSERQELKEEFNLEVCKLWFTMHQADLQKCHDALDTAVMQRSTTCPNVCPGLFSTMPGKCNRELKMSLPPDIYEQCYDEDRGTFNICGLMDCRGRFTGCSITVGAVGLLQALFSLADPNNPVWGGGGGDSDSGLNVGMVVGIVVAANVAILLAVAAFVLVRRHRMRQQQQHVLQLSRLESTSIGGTESPDWKRQKQHVSGGIDIDSADVNVSGKRASGPGSQGIEVTAATAGPAMRGPPPPFASAIGRDSSGILAATSQNQPAAPDGVAGVAALWAGAAQAARSQPSLALDSDPMLAWIHSQMPAEQQQQQQQQGLLPTPFQSHGSSSGGATVVPRTVTPAPSARAIDISRRASSVALMDLAQWEVPYSHLKLIRPLGEGSYGKVFLASLNETMVAVKLLVTTEDAVAAASSGQNVLSLSSPVMTALHKECALMASLRHPNVVLFLGVVYTPPAVVTEYCQRGSLFDVLRAASQSDLGASSLSFQRRLNMALDAAKGMLCLHTHSPPIIHRDLKSPNLLVDSAYRVKVADFNLSRLLEDTGARSSSVGGMLNPRWLAPEVLCGGTSTIKSDVFSFGVVLWEMLTWQLPWQQEAKNAFQLVFAVSSGERLNVPPREEVPAAPEPAVYAAYVALMEQCWAQQPEDRPSFADICSELRSMLTLGAASTGSTQQA